MRGTVLGFFMYSFLIYFKPFFLLLNFLFLINVFILIGG